MGLER